MVLRLEADFEIVGEAENGRVGLESAKNLNPDIALVDLVMPEMDETIRSHAKNILEKMKQRNRTQAMLTAMKLGLIEIQ